MTSSYSSRGSGSHIFWKPGNPPPDDLAASAITEGVFGCTLFPRCIAWISTNESKVALLQGYNAVGYVPPNLFFASSAMPRDILAELRIRRVCTLSAVTLHESTKETLAHAATASQAMTFEAYGLNPSSSNHSNHESAEYPAAVDKSPLHFYCTLDQEVAFPFSMSDETSAFDYSNKEEERSMVVLTMETVVVDGSVLSPPTSLMKDDRDHVLAKIDCEMIRPFLQLSSTEFSPLAFPLRSMPRPRQRADGSWMAPDFALNPNETDISLNGESKQHFKYDSLTWSFRKDGRSCRLGYNPVTAIIIPRPIGWISSYRYSPDGIVASDRAKVAHLAPYSFFSDVSRSDAHPLVAFSGFRKDDGRTPKDAQNDAQQTGSFVYNLVSEDLIIQMNYSAAELGREESEFSLANLAIESSRQVDAPMVREALIRYECEYVKTVDVGTWSIVIGKVVGVHIHRRIVSNGVVDAYKARPVTRLGYVDEYGTLPR